MSEKKKYKTKGTYSVIGARLVKDAEAGETKSGEKYVALVTTHNDGFSETPVWVTWKMFSKFEDAMARAMQYKKGDVLSGTGQPSFYVGKNGAINCSLNVDQRDIEVASPIELQAV